jgi:hypothetical protein
MSTRVLSLSIVALLASTTFAQAPVNDEPAGAIVVGLGTSPGGSGNFFSNVGATNSVTGALISCGSSPHSDVWFSFTPVNSGLHIFSMCPPAGYAPGTMTDSILSITDSTASTALACDDDACAVATPSSSSFMSQVVLSVTAGVPVLLRAASWSATPQGQFYITVVDNTVAGGTNCANALPIVDGAYYGNLANDVPSGYTGGGVCSSFTATTPDIYYSYMSPANGLTTIFQDGGGTGRIAVYNAAPCGTETLVAGTCVTTRLVTFASTAGSTYLIRIGLSTATTLDSTGAQLVSVYTQPFAVPANNDCLGAVPLAAGNNVLSTLGATPDPLATITCPSGSFTASTNNDVWATYTTSAAGTVRFGCSGVGTQQVAVYTGVCGALTPVICAAGSPTTPASVVDNVGGTTYYVRAGTTTAGNRSVINLTVQEIPFPANNDCAGALPLSIGPNPGSTLGATFSAGDPVGTCTGITGTSLDVWHTFTVASACTAIVTRTGTGANQLGIYSGSCGGLTSMVCGTTSAAAVVAPGAYYVRVAQTAAASAGAYSLDFQCVPPPANDECSGAAAAALGANAGTTGGATTSADPVGSCTGFTATTLDAWHSFTTGGAGTYRFTLTGTGANQLGVYDASLGCGGPSLGCGATSVTLALGAGLPVSIRVGQTAFASQGAYTLTLDYVPNDACIDAIPVGLGANGPFSNVGAFTANDVGFSTPTGPGCTLGNAGGSDVFFTYTADCDASLTVSTCGGNNVNEPGVLADTQLNVYDTWTCGVAGNTSIVCSDDFGGSLCGASGFESQVTFNVTAGSTYLVRVAGFSAAQGTFMLTLTRQTAQLVTIGAGCGPGPVPTLVGSGPPVFGSTGTITVTAQPNGFGALFASPPNVGNVYFPFGPCTIYLLQPGLIILTPIGTDGAGLWSLSHTFPAYDPALDCTGVDLQVLVFGVGGVEVTNALRLIFGT